MKHKVGDKVKIREDLVLGELYNGCLFNREKLSLIVTIKGAWLVATLTMILIFIQAQNSRLKDWKKARNRMRG